MCRIPFYQVDAFASQPFTGNPAAILILHDWLADRDMLAIAEENNIAITAFVRPAGPDWELRWFTPTMEASFCGHGTLAAAHVLATERSIGGDFLFTTRAGPLRVSRHSKGYALDLPSLAPEAVSDVPPIIMEIVGGSSIAVFRTARSWFVELADEQAVRDFVPDLAKIATLHPLSFAITAPGIEHDFVSRHFAPGAGVPEDSVTGSTHSTLVPYWVHRLGKDRLSAFQCSRRGGWLSCEMHGDRVHTVGTAITYLKGTVNFQSVAKFPTPATPFATNTACWRFGLQYLSIRGICLALIGMRSHVKRETSPNYLNGVPELLVLRLLKDREMYGYELVQAIRTSTGEAIVLGEGVVYPMLHMLEREGALQSRRQTVAGRSRIYYTLTPTGDKRLTQAATAWTRINEAVGVVLGVPARA